MKLIYFIKLLQRHILLLFLVPVLIALVVFLVNKRGQLNYQSETTIYTGVGSGYSVGQQLSSDWATKAIAYDNMINLIKARQTFIQVSVSLLAQHLLLDHYDSRYISKENFSDIQSKIPSDILDIVRKVKRGDKRYYPSSARKKSAWNVSPDSAASIGNSDASVSTQENEVARKTFHIVKRGETMYSIAKFYGINVQKLMANNRLEDHSLNTGQKLFIEESILPQASPLPQGNEDESETNIISKSNLVDSSNMEDYYTDMDTINTTSQSSTDSTTLDRLVKRLLIYGTRNDFNFIYQLWNSDDPFYSIKALSTVSITRIQNSDLLKLTYTCSDQGICQQTLIFLTKVFIQKYRLLKQNQTDAVIQYFKRQLADAMRRLQKAEKDLLIFNAKNKIINYYEQTRVIASQKEELDVTYQNKQIAYAAADASIKMIERKLETHARLNLNTSAILRLRTELSDVTMQIANLEIDLGNDSVAINQLSFLKSKTESLKQELKRNVDQLYSVINSVEGLPLKDILTFWLNNVIAYEESKAALRVLAERRKYYSQVYTIFAPLGAQMKRFERLIGVTEEEFLTILHDLNMAKLRQQDDELKSNLKVVDPPNYPLRAIPSKTMLLVLASGLIGFILTLALILAMDFFDTTIRTAERAEKFIKFKIIGVYPQITQKIHSIDIGFILSRLVEITIQNIKLALLQTYADEVSAKKPKHILLFSTKEMEGKTSIGREITRKLRSSGENVLFLNFNNEHRINPLYINSGELISPSEDELQYGITESFSEVSTLEMLIKEHEHIDIASYDYVLVEIPSMINNSIPIELIRTFDLSLLVVRANRSWESADVNAMRSFSTLNKHIQIVLNGVDLMYLDSILGELPKERSKLRRALKQFLLFQFGKKM